MKKAGISLGLALFFFSLGISLFAILSNAQVYHITNCTSISESGYYIFDNDIYANSSICFNISSGLNVTIDMNGHTLYPNYVDGNVFYGTGEPKANVTLINGTIEALNGFYGVFSNNLRMYVENVNFTSDGTCCPSFNFYDYIELKNVNISLVSWNSYNLQFFSNTSLDNIQANGQGYLYISLNWPGSLNITNSDLRRTGDIYTYTYLYSTTYILNSSLDELVISGPTSMKNVNLTGIPDVDPVNIKDLYLENVRIGNTQVFYCDGCYGTCEEKYIVVKNSDINVTGSLTEFVYAYNSNVNIDTDSYFRIGQYGGTLNAKGFITQLIIYDTKGTVESYISGTTYDIFPFSDITLTQDNGYISLNGYSTDEPSINITLYGSVEYISIMGYCNLSYNNNITNGYYNGAKLRHNIFGISVGTEGNIWTDFKRYIYEVSKERVRLVDDFEYASGQQVNYTIYNLKPSTTYNVYLNGTLTYTLTSSPDGTLGPFEVTFHSPVEITVEEQWQNPSWCNNLQAYFIMHYSDSKIYITFDESNPNITSVNVNFSVDGVWNNQTGIWNWHPVYNTSILNYYDGNNHTFEFEAVFLNDSAPVCWYAGSFEINPSDETVYITDVWINETHGGFTVDNRGLEYWWQVTIWNTTDYVETVFGSSSSSSVTYAHADLTGQSGEYDTQIDRDLGAFGGIGLLIRNSQCEPYDFRYFSVTFSYASVDFGNVVPYNTYTVEGLYVNISTTAQYSVYIYGNDFSPEWTIDNLFLNISYDGYSASKPFSPYETLFDTFPAQNVTHYHAYTLHVPLVLPGTYSTTVTIDYRL